MHTTSARIEWPIFTKSAVILSISYLTYPYLNGTIFNFTATKSHNIISQFDKIKSYNLNTKETRILLEMEMHPYGFALFKDNLYWTGSKEIAFSLIHIILSPYLCVQCAAISPAMQLFLSIDRSAFLLLASPSIFSRPTILKSQLAFCKKAVEGLAARRIF